MAKAELKLADGTTIQIDGTVDEIAKLLSIYGGTSSASPQKFKVTPAKSSPGSRKKREKPNRDVDSSESGSNALSVSTIVNLIKNSDEAERIEKMILDRIGQVNRTLLPLYVLHSQDGGSDQTLSSGEICQVMKQLGVPISLPNVSLLVLSGVRGP